MSSSLPTIGFLGLGVIGAGMVDRLLDRGFEVWVWNRSPGRCDAAVARGARRLATPAETMTQCDIVGICVSDGAAVDALATGAQGLLSAGAEPPRARAVLDFSTVDPAVALRLSRRAGESAIAWIDCPVSGGPAAARAGTLIGFAGAPAEALAPLRPFTEALFARVTSMGGAGAGQLAKLCNQAIVASNLLVMGETLATARALGMDAASLPAALAGGFADSKPLQIFGTRMASHTFEPKLGALGLMRKDVRLALAQAAAHGLPMPMLEHVGRLYEQIDTHPGMHPDDDISSLIRLFEPV
jgi:3-hydroxyisobutyrate dehydrogenase-like beta-hydroxyacid dehydrogenase